MKYAGYLLLGVGFYAGYAPWHIGIVPVLAFVSVLIYMAARRDHVKARPLTAQSNMIVDGAFMTAVQTLIMFTVYILGWFLANKVSLGSV